MKRKLLVIFFLSLIVSFIIYKVTLKPSKNILFFGENYLIKSSKSYLDYLYEKNYKINTFTYDNITYKDMLKKIKSNDYIIVKNKKIYLNQLISSSDYLIINANNKEYFNKCKKSKNIISNYNDFINNDINDLYNLIKKISKCKIIVISNYCKNDINIEKKDNLNNNISKINLSKDIINKNSENELQLYLFSEITKLLDF